MKNVICKIEKEEVEAIQDLFEKKLALENLIKCIDSDNEKLYNKIVSDYTECNKLYNQWWMNIKIKYSLDEGNFNVDFLTYELFSLE